MKIPGKIGLLNKKNESNVFFWHLSANKLFEQLFVHVILFLMLSVVILHTWLSSKLTLCCL